MNAGVRATSREWIGLGVVVGSDQVELERIRLIEGPGVTHLRFKVAK